MANVTTTTAANFIPEIWANTALSALRSRLRLARLVTKDTDVTNAFTVGDVLHIPAPGTFTANNKTAGAAVSLQAPTDSEVTVTLNKHKEVSFLVEDPVRAQENQSVMDRYATNAVIPIANAIEDDLFALYAGFSATPLGGASAFDAARARSARQVLNDANVPETGRNLVITSSSEMALLSDSNIQSYFQYSRSDNVEEGFVGRLYGFDVYYSNRVPLATTYKNLAFQTEAMILAMRRLPDPPAGSGATSATVTDPESGLMLRATTAYNASYLGVQVTFDVLYGVAELRDACAVVVASSA